MFCSRAKSIYKILMNIRLMKFRFAWNSSDNSSHSKFHHRSGSSSSVKQSVERWTKRIFPEPNRAENYLRLDNNNYHLIWHCLDERFRRDINRFAPLNYRTANSSKTNYRKNEKEKTDSESRLPFSEKGTGKKAKTRKKKKQYLYDKPFRFDFIRFESLPSHFENRQCPDMPFIWLNSPLGPLCFGLVDRRAIIEIETVVYFS